MGRRAFALATGKRGVGSAFSRRNWLWRLDAPDVVGVTGTSEVVEEVMVGMRAGVKGRREKDEGGNEGVEMAAKFSSMPGEGGTTSERRLALRVFLASRFGR